jgi:DNA-binding transcriptional LysR family regulator
MTDIKIFVTLAEQGKMTRVARRLGMTQPGVSQHIASLEEELGQQLFDRKKRRLRLNEAGRAFLEKAKKVVLEFEQLKDFSGQKTRTTGILKLGLTDSSTETIIPRALSKFRESYPGVNLELIVSESEEIEDGVIRKRYDLGVISGTGKPHPLLEEHVIDEDRIDCIVSKKHPLSKSTRVSLAKLAEYPLIVYPRKSRTRQIIDRAFHERGIMPTEVMAVWYNSAAVRLVEAGLGVALLSRFFIENEVIRRKCNHLRISGDPFKRAICVVRKKDAWLSEPAHRFYKLLMGE